MEEMSEWVKVGINKRGLDKVKKMSASEEGNQFSKQKVWNSVKMSARLRGQCREER